MYMYIYIHIYIYIYIYTHIYIYIYIYIFQSCRIIWARAGPAPFLQEPIAAPGKAIKIAG